MSCLCSFSDLFSAAFNRQSTIKELRDLYGLSQEERNAVVCEWVDKAGWVTEDVRGSDGVVYASFGPASENICRR